MTPLHRRRFLSLSRLAVLPSLLPLPSLAAAAAPEAPAPARTVRFSGDGEMFEPPEYVKELEAALRKGYATADRYGTGGAVAALEKRFAEETGKPAAIYMPTGTMANNLAVHVLSGDKTKVFVQDGSHLFRDEADAAQSVFGKRLVPLAEGRAYFTAAELKAAVEGLSSAEVFPSGIGAVSVECPVRRADGAVVPIEELGRISAYCKGAGIPLHLDGARLYMASAYTGVPVKEYARLADTVYISLYKYFGAGAGAVLCGPKEVIAQMPHLIKVHGGSQYQNWMMAAVALHRLDGFTDRMSEARKRGDQLIAALNRLPGITITSVPQGTNIFHLKVEKPADPVKLRDGLRALNIRLPLNEAGRGTLYINETILHAELVYLIDSFKKLV